MKTIIDYGNSPKNYAVVDPYLSRSAQPNNDNLKWLRQQYVTDIINFRTSAEQTIGFNEKAAAEALKIRYHNIQSVTGHPEESSVFEFLDLIKIIKQRRGRAHIHCKAGADRTGMYTFLYKGVNKIGSYHDNIDEWLKSGHNRELFPKLIPWAERMLKKLRKTYK